MACPNPKSFIGSREALELATVARANWFDHRKLLVRTEYIPPAEAEAEYYRHQVKPIETV